MLKFHCSAYTEGRGEARFMVRSENSVSATREAKTEAKRLNFTSVFVEDEYGEAVFNGAAA